MRVRVGILGWLAAAAIGLASRAAAQNPVRLPEVVIKADPGPKAMTGVVRDTLGFLLEGVDITIPQLQRRATTRANGTFRFDDLPRGTHEVRARKIGYGPQVINIKVDSLGGTGDFELVPIPRSLPAVITSASRLGLSGVVADTAFQTLPGVEVNVVGATGMKTVTDSMGRFYLPVHSGDYLVAISKPQFKDKVVSVSIPSDSGRQVRVSLMPGPAVKSPGESTILPDLNDRMTRLTMKYIHLFTRERMEKMGIDWISNINTAGWVQNGGRGLPSPDCYVLVDGGPKIERVDRLTIDEIESVEVYGSGGVVGYQKSQPKRGGGGVVVGKKGIADSRPTMDMAHSRFLRLVGQANYGKACPLTFVWTR